MKRYIPTKLERIINAHYKKHGINTPTDMDIETIASVYNVELEYYYGPSFADWEDVPYGHKLIVLDKRLPKYEQRANFFHELAHILRHCGRQDELPAMFVQLQENQAAQFQLAAALPSFMLKSYDPLPYTISEEFCLPISLVKKRLEQIYSRIISSVRATLQ